MHFLSTLIFGTPFAQYQDMSSDFLSLVVQIFSLIIILIGLYGIVYLLRTVRLILLDKRAAARSLPFEASPKNITAHFLILGDSTAFGTGALDRHDSVAGRLAKDFPNAHIDNHAENGSFTKDIVSKLPQLKEEFFDFALIQVGGNDIFAFKSLKVVRKNILDILTVVKQISNNKVILVSPMNVGSSSLLWFPLTILYSLRSQLVRHVFKRAAKSLDVVVVDLYKPKYRDPFAKEPRIYFAKDGVHPSGDGYGYIYERVHDAIKKHRMILSKAMPQ